MKNLKKAQSLDRKQLKEINGGWDSGYCARLYSTHNCSHINWVRCGFSSTDPSCLVIGNGITKAIDN